MVTPIWTWMRLALIGTAFAAVAVVATTSATASEPLQDANVTLLSLKVNGKGEALFTYRRADGRVRRVLAWGALNAHAPSADVPQVRFHWDYAGGWGKHRNGRRRDGKRRDDRERGPSQPGRHGEPRRPEQRRPW